MKHEIISFAFEILAFIVVLGIFTFIPINQLIIQGSIFSLSIYVLIVSVYKKITLKQLGFILPSKEMVLKWMNLTLMMIIGIIILKIVFPEGLFVGVAKNRRVFLYLIPFYILVGTFFQELVFRGYLFARTSKLFVIKTSIIINIILFSVFHIPYFVQYQSNLLYLSIVSGICWSIMYAKYPNLYMAWISHAVVGSINLLLLQKF
ncbi:MAG: CPBP family intramembrane metalloprotease [Candidatus Roizmanbacteria bacterium]|nr:CPBP family intramembrane metalloprotease [Candidatus Roizmanbacteria bacterium]